MEKISITLLSQQRLQKEERPQPANQRKPRNPSHPAG